MTKTSEAARCLRGACKRRERATDPSVRNVLFFEAQARLPDSHGMGWWLNGIDGQQAQDKHDGNSEKSGACQLG